MWLALCTHCSVVLRIPVRVCACVRACVHVCVCVYKHYQSSCKMFKINIPGTNVSMQYSVHSCCTEYCILTFVCVCVCINTTN